MFSCEYCEILKKTYLEEHLRMAASVLLIIKLVMEILGICQPLLNQKDNVEWFLPKWFADLVRVYFLLIISGNHSNTFLIIDLQKTKTCPK